MKALLELKNIHKRFPGVYALKDVQFSLQAGEVHALMGENGAGKSTLIKIIAGVYDFEGEYLLDGASANIKRPSQAIDSGVSVIYQELNLCLNLTVAENIFFDRWSSGFIVNRRQMNNRAREILAELGFNIRPEAVVASLSTAQQQLVEIAKSVSLNAKIIVMDEPTSALSNAEIGSLFQVIDDLKARGIGIIYVSHKLDEIFRLADKVTVLRDGQYVATRNIQQLDEAMLIAMMVGRELDETYPKTENELGEIVLEAKNITNERLKDVSFHIRGGEIIGFSGLMGAGRTELAKAVFGFDKRRNGSVSVVGKEIKSYATWEAVKAGIGYVPEDRKNEGIFKYLSVLKNITISSEDEISPKLVIDFSAQRDIVDRSIAALNIKTPNRDQFVEKLSGGNQQKVILARWFVKQNIKILIVDEPTRGIDVGAKREIYTLLNEFAQKGMAIIIMSSEMPEILGMCDRIYVMSGGEIRAELTANEATQEILLKKSI